MPADSLVPSTWGPLLSSLHIYAPRGPLSKHWSNDLRPRQLLVSSLLTKELKPKPLKKEGGIECKYLWSNPLQSNLPLFFICFHKTQG